MCTVPVTELSRSRNSEKFWYETFNVPVGQRLGGRLATTLVATKNIIIWHERLAFQLVGVRAVDWQRR